MQVTEAMLICSRLAKLLTAENDCELFGSTHHNNYLRDAQVVWAFGTSYGPWQSPMVHGKVLWSMAKSYGPWQSPMVHGKLVYTATTIDKRACCIGVNFTQDVAGVCAGR